MYHIDYNHYRSVKGFNRRVRFLVMHYTALNFAGSVAALSGDGGVSAHYLVPDPADQSYIDAGFGDMRIFNLVDENERAWHAGVSTWGNRTNLNDTAIGIEIVNPASDDGHGNFTFPPYNAVQIDAVRELALNILQRYPDITATNIIGHSDISVGRKSDPGPEFPWKALYMAGIGAWYDHCTKLEYQCLFARQLPAENEIMARLKRYGYDTSNIVTAADYQNLIRAFQLHFRPQDYNGVVDAETAAILYALIDRYFPEKEQ